jgi:hypothetical protein
MRDYLLKKEKKRVKDHARGDRIAENHREISNREK